MFSIEIIRSRFPATPPSAALFDFDGTLSLIREGWHKILIDMNVELLRTTPKGKLLPERELVRTVKDFVQLRIGKQTIYQSYALVEANRRFEGAPIDPREHNAKYMELLRQRIEPRLEALRRGSDPEEWVVPGTYGLLDMLKKRGLKLYLASGTEDPLLKEDARLLRLTDYFDGGIYGGLPNPDDFSKAMIVEKILGENGIRGAELIGFGDGHTETEDVRRVDGFVVGVASNEATRQGIDPWKRDQLIASGADWIIPDYSDIDELESRLFDRVGT